HLPPARAGDAPSGPAASPQRQTAGATRPTPPGRWGAARRGSSGPPQRAAGSPPGCQPRPGKPGRLPAWGAPGGARRRSRHPPIRLGGARGLRRAEQGLPGLPEVAEARLTDVVDHPAVAAHVALRAAGAHGHRMVVAVGAPRHALGADGLAPGVQVEVPAALVAALTAAGRSRLEGAL